MNPTAPTRLLLALSPLLLLVSGSAAMTSCSAQPPPLRAPAKHEPVQPATPDTSGRFQLVLMGSDSRKGVESDIAEWKAADGVLVIRSVQHHPSPRAAKVAMRHLVRKADKVIDQGTKQDRQGNTTGERAVLMAHRWRGEVRAVIVWLDGPELYLIESTSLQDALEFEHVHAEVQRRETSKPKRP